MPFQSKNGPERLPAKTLVRSIIAVDHHMVSETFSVGILLVANSTLESSGSCVDNHVIRQSSLSTKCMDNHVLLQILLMIKSLPTLRTPIDLYLCMDNHVPIQMSLMTKCLPTFSVHLCALLQLCSSSLGVYKCRTFGS